jgi:cytosine/adenosine deaminase-related metal-dependent hydrolase
MLRTLAAAAATLLLAADASADQPSFRFDNGLWFNGERFVPATVFVEYGQLRFAKDKKSARAQAEKIVDLAGKHVAPPFCEAHNHNLGLDDLARKEYFITRAGATTKATSRPGARSRWCAT